MRRLRTAVLLYSRWETSRISSGGARLLMRRMTEAAPLRLIGAGISGIGLAVFVQQIVPAV